MRSRLIFILTLIFSINLNAQDYFAPVESTGLPYILVVTDMSIDNHFPEGLGEIGVFDGDLCVGSASFDNFSGNNISVVAWQEDTSFGLDGFSPGNSITLKLWTEVFGEYYEFEANTYFSIGDGTFGSGNYSALSLDVDSGYSPEIILSSDQLSIGPTELGNLYAGSVQIYNQGNANLSIFSAFSDNDQFECIIDDNQIADGDSTSLRINYTPNILIDTQASIYIQSDDPSDSTIVLNVYGDVFKPEIQISQESLNFGSVNISQTRSLDIEILNSGEYNLEIFSASIDNNEYSLSSDYYNIIPDSSAILSVTYTPTQLGLANAIITLETNDLSSSQIQIPVQGAGLPEISSFISVTNTNVDFGSIVLGESIELEMYIENLGNDPLEIYSITSTNNAFSIDFDYNQILPGELSVVSIEFTPIVDGQHLGTMNISSSAPNEPNIYVDLNGYGFTPYFNPVASTGLPYNVIIQEISLDNHLLEIGDEVAIFDGDLCVGSSIYNGDIMEMVVWQENIDAGLDGYEIGNPMTFMIWGTTFNTTLEVIANPEYSVGDGTFGFGSYSVVSLSSLSFLEPDIRLSNDDINYSAQPIPGEYVFDLEVFNDGILPLTIYNIVSSNEVFSTNLNNFVIQGNSSQIVSIVFSPTEGIDYSGTIEISSDDPYEDTMLILLEGAGISPIIDVSTSLIDFGAVEVGQTLEFELEIGNYSPSDLELASLEISGDVFTINPSTLTVFSETSEIVTITFIPNSPNPYYGNISIMSNDVESTELTIPVQGQGLAAQGPEVNILTPELNLGDCVVGSSVNADIIIQNTGNTVLELSNITTSNDQFAVSNDIGNDEIIIDPGDLGIVSIEFSPEFVGEVDGFITFESSTSETIEVYVYGLGYNGFFNEVSSTGLPSTLLVSTIDFEELSSGDEIGVFDGSICVGVGVVSLNEDSILDITIWQATDDNLDSGFTIGNLITFYYYSATHSGFVNVVYNIESNFQIGDGYFSNYPLYVTDLIVGENSTDFGCTDIQADNYNPYVTIDDGSCEYSFDMGDVNFDGSINILDAIRIMNHILGNTELEDPSLADLNFDGEINIFDIILVINIILDS